MAGFGRIILQFCAIFTSKGHVLTNFPTTYYVHSNEIPIKSTNQQNWEYIQEMVMDLSGRWSVITAELSPSFHLLESTSPEQAKVSGISAVTFFAGYKASLIPSQLHRLPGVPESKVSGISVVTFFT